MTTQQQTELEEKRKRLSRFVSAGAALSSTMGINHVAVFARDLEATAEFYSQVLRMPVTAVVVNRDEPLSTHMTVDVGNGMALAFFDFPHVQRIQEPVREGVGGMMHVEISITPERFKSGLPRSN